MARALEEEAAVEMLFNKRRSAGALDGNIFVSNDGVLNLTVGCGL